MNSVQRTLALGRVCARHYAQAAVPSAQFSKLKGKQAKFQTDDGLPVFLKGGVTDKILYQATLILTLVGLGMMSKLFYDLAVPKKE